jgi:hypothetical protein
MECRHGPIGVAGAGTAPEGLREQAEATGGTFLSSGPDPMAAPVAVARAVARGLAPDEPTHLTRSVILSS